MEVNYFQIIADLCHILSSPCLKADMQYAKKVKNKKIYPGLENEQEIIALDTHSQNHLSG